jgi:large subunit ribosomal protein L35
MPKQKLKTRHSMSKRIKVTGTGKILHVKGNRSHKRSIKSKRTLRLLHRMFRFPPAEERRARRLAPFKK